MFNSLIFSQHTVHLAYHCPQPQRPAFCPSNISSSFLSQLFLLPGTPSTIPPLAWLFLSFWSKCTHHCRQAFPIQSAPRHQCTVLLNSPQGPWSYCSAFLFSFLLPIPLPLTHLLPGGLDLVAEHSIQQLFMYVCMNKISLVTVPQP